MLFRSCGAAGDPGAGGLWALNGAVGGAVLRGGQLRHPVPQEGDLHVSFGVDTRVFQGFD